jgi:molybdopterin synthase sulfur carrier subunit
MIIYVKLYAALAENVSRHLPTQYPQGIRAGARLEVELAEGSSLADLMTHLGLPKEQVKVSFVNGRHQDLEHSLEPGDEVGIFPPIGGG